MVKHITFEMASLDSTYIAVLSRQAQAHSLIIPFQDHSAPTSTVAFPLCHCCSSSFSSPLFCCPPPLTGKAAYKARIAHSNHCFLCLPPTLPIAGPPCLLTGKAACRAHTAHLGVSSAQRPPQPSPQGQAPQAHRYQGLSLLPLKSRVSLTLLGV